MTASPRPTPGLQLGRFVLLERLGDGAMGEVYRAHDPQLGRVVAVKVVRGVTDERRRRFVREQQAAARVRHHGVVAVHDAGEADGVGWLAMDLVEGESLEAVLRRGPLEPQAALRLVTACARAVEALHAAGVLHRDLKPANILVDREGNPRLTDFGVAALAGAEALTRTGQVVGTPLYMAPEQLTGGAVDERADVYALGAVLFEALVGSPPWSADSFAELAVAKTTLPAPPSRARRAAGSRSGSGSNGSRPGPLELRADEVVLRALAPDPVERPPSAAALADALERSLTGEGAPRGRGRLLAGLGLLLLLAGSGAALGLGPRQVEPAEPPAALLGRLEARAARGLADLPPELLAAAAAVGSRQPGGAAAPADPAAAALRAWVGLAALAAGDPERAALAAPGPAEAPAGGAPALALRGALTAERGDSVAALADLDAALQAGLRLPELEVWRARAQARRGVERAEAGPLLARVAALRTRGGAGSAAADLLEVACLLGQGRRAPAEAALGRLADPPVELVWDLALLTTQEALVDKRAADALRALSDAPPRPPRPPSRREGEVATLALALVRQHVEPAGSLHRGIRAEIVTGLAIHERLTPPAPRELGLKVVAHARTSVVAGHSLGVVEVLLATSAVWADDEAVQAEVVDTLVGLRFLNGNFLVADSPEVEAQLEAAGRRAAAVSRRGQKGAISARLVQAAALLHLGRPDEAATTLDELDAATQACVDVPADELRLATASALLLRARLASARGDADLALRTLEQTAAPAAEQLVTYVRLTTLREAGRTDALLACAREHAQAAPFVANMAILGPLRDLVWDLLSGRDDEWKVLGDYYTRFLDKGGDHAPPLVARAVLALARSGRVEEAVRRARELVKSGDMPAAFPAGVARGDPAALAAAARLAAAD